METNLQLEASKAELARQILNIDNADALNTIRRALGRVLQRQDKAAFPPCHYSIEEVKQRLAITMPDAIAGRGISEEEAERLIEEML